MSRDGIKKSITFEVLVTAVIHADAPHVIFETSNIENWEVGDDSTIGGKPIKKWLSQPRALDKSGKPRLDVFNVILEKDADAGFFERDKLYELKVLYSAD